MQKVLKRDIFKFLNERELWNGSSLREGMKNFFELSQRQADLIYGEWKREYMKARFVK